MNLVVPCLASVEGGLDTLFGMLENGGPLIVPIGLCSILALGYAVERSIALRRSRLLPSSLVPQLKKHVDDSDISAAVSLCERDKSPMARVLGLGLSKVGCPIAEVEKSVEDAGRREVLRLSANLRPLQVIASVAPLMGLLGTVWGMIRAFSVIAGEKALGKPELLADGIAQALITTAAGLAIAIPTHILYHYFKSRVDRFARDVEESYVNVVEDAARLAVGRAA